MVDNFIQEIHVRKIRDIKQFTIPLEENERQHLIITGKNGSGKTSLLTALSHFFYSNMGVLAPAVNLSVTLLDLSMLHRGKFLFAFFEAKRQTEMNVPVGITKLSNRHVSLHDKRNTQFLQYIVNLKAERSFARDDQDEDTVRNIDTWFANFENQLRILFDSPSFELRFDRKQYLFTCHIEGKEPFGFNELSDGYSAVIAIITELILRMDQSGYQTYDQQGVVLIDEIETHLHVDLQKKILPFLCDFFPKIQFIVATHSPFVIQSVENAVICDLEKRIVTSDLSGYSYDTLIETYFKVDQYSDDVKEKLVIYEQLLLNPDRSDEEQETYRDLRLYFSGLPKYLAEELHLKLKRIERQAKRNRKQTSNAVL